MVEKVYLSDFKYYVLSHGSTVPVVKDGVTFDTLLHGYYWSMFTKGPPKVSAVDLRLIQSLILQAPSSDTARTVASKYKSHRHPEWTTESLLGEAHRNKVLFDLIGLKYYQHQYVADTLNALKGVEIIDDTWKDPYWGQTKEGSGLNVSGISLCWFRDSTRSPKASFTIVDT